MEHFSKYIGSTPCSEYKNTQGPTGLYYYININAVVQY